MSYNVKVDNTRDVVMYRFDESQNFLTKDNIGDLPYNAYIDKGITGCGGTTLALTNDEFYVVAVPMVRLIENKITQHPNVMWFKSTSSFDDVTIFMQNGGKKIMVTYDSLTRLIECIPFYIKKFRLLVDEVQLLIQYGGFFKSRVCNDVVYCQDKFKSVSYITATPTPRKYLPEALKTLDYYEFHWASATRASIHTSYVSRDIGMKTLTFILDKLDNTDKNIYVFYNSISDAISCVQRLIKVTSLKREDIGVIFADNTKNVDKFKKAFGRNFEFDEPVYKDSNDNVEYLNKRVVFVSSMGFQGLDFYSNKDIISLIVSDPKKKSMRYDAYIDIPQIAGRFRKHPITGFEPKNSLYFLWTSSNDNMNLSEEEYEKSILQDIEIVKSNISNISTHKSSNFLSSIITLAENAGFLIEENDHVYFNDLIYSSKMSTYSSMHLDFKINNISADDMMDANVNKKLSNIFDNNTYHVGPLSATYSEKLNKGVSYSKVAREYFEIFKQMRTDNSIIQHQDKMNELISLCPELEKHLGLLSISSISSMCFSKSVVEKKYIDVLMQMEFYPKIQNRFKINDILTSNEIVCILISISPSIGKIKYLKDCFDIKKSTKNIEGKLQQAYKIISKKELNNE